MELKTIAQRDLVVLEYLRADLDVFNTRFDGLRAEEDWEVDDFEKATQKLKELKKEFSSVFSRIDEIGEKEAKLMASMASVLIEKRWIRIGESLALLGISLMAFGFYLWYIKLQRYQDKIIKKQADEAA